VSHPLHTHTPVQRIGTASRHRLATSPKHTYKRTTAHARTCARIHTCNSKPARITAQTCPARPLVAWEGTPRQPRVAPRARPWARQGHPHQTPHQHPHPPPRSRPPLRQHPTPHPHPHPHPRLLLAAGMGPPPLSHRWRRETLAGLTEARPWETPKTTGADRGAQPRARARNTQGLTGSTTKGVPGHGPRPRQPVHMRSRQPTVEGQCRPSLHAPPWRPQPKCAARGHTSASW
jgi:hypothetical protein